MLTVQVFNKESGKKIVIGVDETTTILAFMQQLRNKGLIDINKPYYLTTADGTFCAPAASFQQLREREFDIYQGILRLPTFLQLGIFVIDGSGSMLEGTVAGHSLPSHAVNDAMKKTILNFKNSSKRECFSFSVVAFGDEARVILTPQKVEDINAAQSFIATDLFNDKKGSESTNIASGLAIAVEQAKYFLANKKGNLIHRVVVVVLTDGMCHHEEETRSLADQLKLIPNLEICSCHFETGVNETGAVNLLKDISHNYETVYDEETIRDFFIHSTQRTNHGGTERTNRG